MSFIKQHKIISSLILVNIVVGIIAIIVIVMHQVKTAVVDINVAPSVATITLNGREYENSKSHNVLPGNYHVKISMDGMQTKEFDITLENDGFSSIKTYLLDNNNSFDYYLSHSSDVFLLENIADIDDQKAQDFIKLYKKKASLADYLPLYFDEYTDDFAYYIQYNISQDPREDCSKVLCLIIEDNTGDNEERAKEKIRELEYNLEDYEIIYQYVPLYGAEANE